MNKYNVYYTLVGYQTKHYVLVEAYTANDAQTLAAIRIIKKHNGKEYKIECVEESKGFYAF